MAMKFGEMIKLAQPQLVISKRYDEWMKTNSNPVYSQHALDFGAWALKSQATPRDRRGTFSASSLWACQRRQQFTFLGLPEDPVSTRLGGIFQNGTFMHIRWQMAGLTEGFLVDVEVPIGSNDMNLSGTQDAIAYDGSVVELKSIHTNGFSQINTFGPKDGHIYQVGTYLLATDAPRAVILYEDKNTQEYVEFVFTRAELERDHVLYNIAVGAQMVWDATNHKQLVHHLDECAAGEGRYRGCQFASRCLGIRSWEQAEELASVGRQAAQDSPDHVEAG
jgi:hypothetical protein